MRAVLARASVLAMLLASLAWSWACQEETTATVLQEHSRAALVALAQSYHVQADLALEQQREDLAEAAMRALLVDLRRAGRTTQTGWELELDASARLARLLLEDERPEEAMRALEEPLSSGARALGDNIFVGYLLQLQGDTLRVLGRHGEAVDAHKQAILLFKRLLELP